MNKPAFQAIQQHSPNKPTLIFVSFLGLSTALANAKDLADWLGIEGQTGLYNFRPSVRPVPLEVHISGYPGKHYCPRMISMNKPAFQAIQQHSPNKPTLIFVSSRRQTRLTALDLIALSGNIFIPRRYITLGDFRNISSILIFLLVVATYNFCNFVTKMV